MRGGFEKALRHRSKGHNLQRRIHSPKSEDEDTEKTSLPTRLRLKSVEVGAVGPLCFHRYEVACEVEVRLQSAGKQQPGSRPRIPPSPSSPSFPSFAFEKYMMAKMKS